MLRQRVITALILVALLLPALFHATPEPLAGLTLLLIAAGAWEWGRLNQLDFKSAMGLALACLALCVLSWAQGWPWQPSLLLWQIAGGCWVLAGAWLLRQGVAGWPLIPRALRCVAGVLALWLTWLAVFQAKVMGSNFLLSMLLLVWMADVAAYFAGRAFGRRKLAPGISPGKSWEGVYGGMLGVLMLALAWIAADQRWFLEAPSLYTHLLHLGWFGGLLGLLFLTVMSVVGDLVESLVKRSAGVKDSSHLLPGHGGVLDRVDALLPTLPLAMMLALS
ncbi:MAG: phosphatidate cytidylyltransferase [Limnohabitans sp.]|nr:phosphatidate cytidylyltransferase [Limnohabitans sp.]